MIAAPVTEALVSQCKQALRRVPATVFVLAAKAPNGECGAITVTAFSSVTMEPPTILVCLNRSSSFRTIIDEAEFFSANLLGAEQKDISNDCAGRLPLCERTSGEDWITAESDAPYVSNALASLICEKVAEIDHGSHRIFLGAVKAVHLKDESVSPALIYENGAYTRAEQFDHTSPFFPLERIGESF